MGYNGYLLEFDIYIMKYLIFLDLLGQLMGWIIVFDTLHIM